MSVFSLKFNQKLQEIIFETYRMRRTFRPIWPNAKNWRKGYTARLRIQNI